MSNSEFNLLSINVPVDPMKPIDSRCSIAKRRYSIKESRQLRRKKVNHVLTKSLKKIYAKNTQDSNQSG